MNGHALGVLEFDKVVRMLVERTSFEPAAERAARLAPSTDPEQIRHRLGLTGELRTIIDDGGALPFGRASDIREAVARSAREGAALSPADLAAIASTLSAIGDVRRALEARREKCPGLWVIASTLCLDERLVEAIGRAIDTETLEVRDSASRELARIRRSITSTRTKLDEKLASILESERSAETIQEAAVHIRNGRSVLPVKRSARAKIRGSCTTSPRAARRSSSNPWGPCLSTTSWPSFPPRRRRRSRASCGRSRQRWARGRPTSRVRWRRSVSSTSSGRAPSCRVISPARSRT